MIKRISTLILTLGLLSTPLLQAQDNTNENTSEQSSNLRFWEANLPGGNYMVALSRISSVSMSKYYLKGAVVYEVTVDTNGASLARFYAIEAAGEDSQINIAKNLSQRGKELAERVGKRANTDINTAVTKEYPLTTHEKNIEFRLADYEDLEALYSSLTKSWKAGRGRKFSVK